MGYIQIRCGTEQWFTSWDEDATAFKFIQEAFNNYEVVVEDIDIGKYTREVHSIIKQNEGKWVLCQTVQIQKDLNAVLQLDPHGYPWETLKEYDVVRDLNNGKKAKKSMAVSGSNEDDEAYYVYKGAKSKSKKKNRGTGYVYVNFVNADDIKMYFALENNDPNNVFTSDQLKLRAIYVRKEIIKAKMKLDSSDGTDSLTFTTDEGYIYNNMNYKPSLWEDPENQLTDEDRQAMQQYEREQQNQQNNG